MTIEHTKEGRVFSSVFLLFQRMKTELKSEYGIKSKIKIHQNGYITLSTTKETIAEWSNKTYNNQPKINVNIDYYASLKNIIEKSKETFSVDVKLLNKFNIYDRVINKRRNPEVDLNVDSYMVKLLLGDEE